MIENKPRRFLASIARIVIVIILFISTAFMTAVVIQTGIEESKAETPAPSLEYITSKPDTIKVVSIKEKQKEQEQEIADTPGGEEIIFDDNGHPILPEEPPVVSVIDVNNLRDREAAIASKNSSQKEPVQDSQVEE